MTSFLKNHKNHLLFLKVKKNKGTGNMNFVKFSFFFSIVSQAYQSILQIFVRIKKSDMLIRCEHAFLHRSHSTVLIFRIAPLRDQM